jgi:hypothetical protein
METGEGTASGAVVGDGDAGGGATAMEVEGGGAAAGGEAAGAKGGDRGESGRQRDRGKRKRGARTDRAGCNAREATRRPAEATAGETMADAPREVTLHAQHPSRQSAAASLLLVGPGPRGSTPAMHAATLHQEERGSTTESSLNSLGH